MFSEEEAGFGDRERMLSEEEAGFGDRELTDTDNLDEGVANDLTNAADSYSGSGNCPGAAGDSRGYRSASFQPATQNQPCSEH